MKIDPTSVLRAAKTRPSARAHNGAGGNFAGSLSAGERASGVATSSGIASIDALVALQGIGDAPDREQEAIDHGESLLDSLDELRLDLLSGRVPQSRLETLRDTLARATWRQGANHNPALLGVLAEIETRVAVELAKLGR